MEEPPVPSDLDFAAQIENGAARDADAVASEFAGQFAAAGGHLAG